MFCIEDNSLFILFLFIFEKYSCLRINSLKIDLMTACFPISVLFWENILCLRLIYVYLRSYSTSDKSFRVHELKQSCSFAH
jgi:hypothetical protein